MNNKDESVLSPLEFRILYESVGLDQRGVGQFTGIRVVRIADMIHGRRRISSRAVEWLRDLVKVREQLVDTLLARFENASTVVLPFDPETDWQAQFCNHTILLVAWTLEGNGVQVSFRPMHMRSVFNQEFLTAHPSANSFDNL